MSKYDKRLVESITKYRWKICHKGGMRLVKNLWPCTVDEHLDAVYSEVRCGGCGEFETVSILKWYETV